MNRVLLIEDNLEIRENTTELLELGGYQVLTAMDGNEGISAALTHLPDVILCDIQMPVKTGYEVFLSVKANPATAKIPFLFVTASVEKKEIQLAMGLGADGYICKPFDADELYDKIKAILNTSN